MNKNEVRMREELESLLTTNGGVSTKEATELLRVSESTVRRLFDKMQADGEAVRVFGGVRYANTATKYQYDVTLERQRKAKTQIGKLAASIITDNDFVYIDCGTTTIHLCEFIVERIHRGELTGITVVTNSLAHLEILNKSCTTILTSGIYSADRKSFAGTLCESFLSQFHFSKAFLGAAGFSLEDGFSTSEIEIAHLTGVAAALADSTYVLLDSTKLGRRSFVVYDKFENIRNMITDSAIDPDTVAALGEKNVRVFIAD